MKKVFILWLSGILVFAATVLWAEKIDYSKIDQHARQAPEKIHTDLDKLVKYLSKPAANDYERVRSFYSWIAENIAYDVQLFRSYRPSRYQPLAPADVLKRRKAVCQGYAELFQEMCRKVGIKSYVVGGYSKGFGYTPKAKFTVADHAWNVVQIADKWYLIDVTWGSGGLNDRMKFVKQFNEQYFLTDPKVFVLNHLPLAPMWQLLDCPVPVMVYAQSEEQIRAYLNERGSECQDYSRQIADFESKTERDQEFYAAQMAYDFNPDNPVVLARAYLNEANRLMSDIPRKLSSRESILQATETQESALDYLKKAEKLVKTVKGDSANQEKQLIASNIKTSEQNLKGLRNAIK
ncbi:transglutaminase domain-containing protein [Tunicatimonas pelagia]|uniref:transglutaminase domain-containing protein n=1 Tax=Tunicatimonas pelagia TaxID=931531 RepID=UPI002665622B|nr:transglutaminase domain-containing protein [Tunicatimonas pelagia]WKN42840.1 transglutaminase domain-containing protein [Tunicatimonas pelagia]